MTDVDLELVETRALLDELGRRNNCIVVIVSRPTRAGDPPMMGNEAIDLSIRGLPSAALGLTLRAASALRRMTGAVP